MIKTFFIFIITLFVVAVNAEISFGVEPFVAPSISKDVAININSNRMELSGDLKKVFLYDNVKVVQEDSRFFADKMIGFYDKVVDNNTGEKSTKFSKIDAYNNVRFESDKIVITGKTGSYDVKKGEFEISGDAVANEKGVKAHGDRFVYNVKTKETKMFGNKKNDSRVKIVLDNVSEVEERIKETKKQ